jgi:hypothetical protein
MKIFILATLLALTFSLTPCQGDEPAYPFTCPMEFRIKFKNGEPVGYDETKDCEYRFTSSTQYLKKCPRCFTSMKKIKKHVVDLRKKVAEILNR